MGKKSIIKVPFKPGLPPSKKINNNNKKKWINVEKIILAPQIWSDGGSTLSALRKQGPENLTFVT